MPGAAPSARDLRVAAWRLRHYVKGQRAAYILGIVAFFASSALEPLVPALFNQLIDQGFKPQMAFPLALVPVVIVGLFLLRGVLAFIGSYLFASATSFTVLDMRTDLVQAVMRADASLYVSLSPGVAASRVINDPQNAVAGLSGAVTTLLREGTSLVALLGYLFYLDWRLTLVSLVTAPVLIFTVHKVQRRIVAIGGQSYASLVRLIGVVDDIARAWRVVRTFDAGAFEQRRFADEANRLRRTTLKATVAGSLMTPLTQVIASIGVALIVTLALRDAQHGGATVGQFVAFLTALLMTISPLRRLTDITQPIVGGLIVCHACFALMDTPPEADTGTGELDRAEGDLRFERVSVAYSAEDRPALDGISLHLPAGTTTALVGHSGAGKSTLVNALLGFVAPSSGRALIDGIDIGSLRKTALRRQFAVVSQDIVLFDGSVEDNVAYGKPKDAARVETCLRAANLWEFVESLPEGAGTLVGTNGNRLSGGQRQRLAIARALYKQASVWVFDEATSSLDTESERIVHQSIERWRGSKTLLLIAHRLSTVRHADCIHVLSEGRVVESGPHEQLMARGGLYAGMVRAQSMD